MKPKGRGRIFYGWWIVAAAALIGLYTGGTSIYGFTVFVNPLAQEFGWSYVAVSAAVSIGGLAQSVTAPPLGFLVDRFGPRKLLLGGALVGGLGLFLLSRSNSLTTYYVAFVVLATGAGACGSLVLNTAVAQWFKRKVGIAMGLTTAGIGMGGLLVPVMAWLINQYQWRMAMVILGIGNLLIISALSLVIRRRPEQYGWLPDGAPHLPAPETPEVGTVSSPPEPEFKASQALKSGTYLLLVLALSLEFTALMAVVLHVVPYLSSVKLTEAQGAWVATFLPILSIAGRLGFGWLSDKWTKKYLLAFTLGLQVIGLLAFTYAPSLWSLIAFIIAFGAGYGGSIALTPALTREYFGPNVFGSISGVTLAITGIVGQAGPVFAGWVFDTKGSYHLAWISLAVVMAIAIVPILAIKKKGAT